MGNKGADGNRIRLHMVCLLSVTTETHVVVTSFYIVDHTFKPPLRGLKPHYSKDPKALL